MDLETKLRETMHRHAPSPTLRPMPSGTASRIIRRRVAAMATTMAVAVALVAGTVGLFRYLSAGSTVQRPAAEATVAIPSPTEPGVTYMTPAPFADLTPGQWPDAEAGGIENPYVDRETGVELDKTVVASGFVEGAEWSMTSFAMHGWGVCGELFLGDWGDYGGVRFCSHVASEPGQTDLKIAGTSFGLGPITAYTGVVSREVDHLLYEAADGSRRSVDIVQAAPGLVARSFVLFVPIDAAGRFVAFAADGSRVAAESLCVGSPAPVEQVAACGNGLATTFSAVSALP